MKTLRILLAAALFLGAPAGAVTVANPDVSCEQDRAGGHAEHGDRHAEQTREPACGDAPDCRCAGQSCHAGGAFTALPDSAPGMNVPGARDPAGTRPGGVPRPSPENPLRPPISV